MVADLGFGHVFVVRGDVLAMAGDVLVVPTDVAGWVEQPWRAHLVGLGVGFEGQGDGPGRLAVQERAHIGGRVAVEADSGRQVWLLASGVSPADRAASASEVVTGQDRQTLSGVLERFAAPAAGRPV